MRDLRLDTLDAVDSVCDQSGDKGVDGIYLNSDANIIDIYESKLFQKRSGNVGDKLLRKFSGTLSQFTSDDSISNLIASAGDSQVAKLAARLDLVRHVREFSVIGYFICNGEIDSNGRAFLRSVDDMRFLGKNELESSFVASARHLPAAKPISFNVSGYDTAEYIVDKDHRAIIAPIKGKELVGMEGIANQSVFAFNVRGPLGRTQVNRDIAISIGEAAKHKLFPLFHNGITIIAEGVDVSSDSIDVENYFVVNGCQSLNALFRNAHSLTDTLRILTKFIKASPTSQLAEMITRFSNNENGVKARDFKSNN